MKSFNIFGFCLTGILFVVFVLQEDCVAQSQELFKENQDTYSLQYAGSTLWGNVQDMVKDGSYLYCAMSAGLEIFQITDEHEFIPLSKLYFQCGTYCLDKSGNYLYLGLRDSGMAVVDVSDIIHPSLIRKYDLRHPVPEIEIFGNYAFLALDVGFDVIDISNPYAPGYIRHYELSGSSEWMNIHEMIIRDNIAYLAADDLWILDVSDVENILQLAHVEFPVEDNFNTYLANDLDIGGNMVYIAAQSAWQPPISSALLLYDISNLSNPIPKDEYVFPGSCFHLTVSGDYAYVGAGLSGLLIFEISNPASLIPVGCTHIDNYYTLESIQGNEGELIVIQLPFYTTGYDYGVDICNGNQHFEPAYPQKLNQLLIFDISDKSSPIIIGSLEDTGIFVKVTISGLYAYVVDLLGGFYIVGISNPDSLSVLSYMDLEGSLILISGGDINVFDGVAYFAAGENGLYGVDVNDPLNPTLLFHYDSPGHLYDVAIHDHYLFAVDGFSGIQVLDISDIENPVHLYQIPVADYACEIAIQGSYAFICCRAAGLQIFDISNVDNIFQTALFPIDNDLANEIVLGNNIAFINGGSSNFYSINISNPYNPELLHLENISEIVYDLAWQNGKLYIANFYGMTVFDVSNPETPIKLAEYDLLPWNQGVAVSDSTIIITDYYSLIRLRHHIITSAGDNDDAVSIPIGYSLSQNCPNPFNNSTIIEFEIPMPGRYSLNVYNILGQKVRILIDGIIPAGRYQTIWDGMDDNAKAVASGTYLYKLKGLNYCESKKMILLK